MPEAYIIDAVRTPRGIGKPGKGSLAHLHPQVLGATVLKALKDRNNLKTEEVDDIIWGCATQVDKQGADLGRMSALLAGYDVKASGVTLDRFCGSGITSVSFAAGQIMSGMEDLVVAGGTDMMSFTASLADPTRLPLMDKDNPLLREIHPQSNQGVCADAIATLEGISRDATEALAVESQKRAARAIEEGRFEKSLIPVRNEDGSIALDREEFPRPDTSRESLAGLKASFAALADIPVDDAGNTYRSLINRKYPDVDIQHIHHAGTSSGVVDGSAAILLASPDYAKKQGWKPRARIVTAINVGDCPTLMLNAPVPAAEKALDRAGLTKNDIDVWEINEAFAVVAEKFIRDLDLPRDKVNINGGAMALGHPIGATGSILIGTALDELERSGGKYALITMCAAGGMAPAIIIERL
ncbi:MAG TPA: acetyl-CoA C-acyltransferase [Hyphomonas sp.]|uniref:acetyl-CoA C-acetyltransferase n=1 Tax=Hyphomonas sp. UBA5107 TaxID=1946636 RepID=UPI000C686C8F|nr:acetyl-CoA C-acetyltransferase [Hyphomonas sp. UBA5107]MAA81143.1 acetyl-CoA C-acyltransferase [Hyphomonas sp.]MAN65681.1 acetyl-CoA C-acyltransferase [Hyphomonadaceae bacterium]HBL92371.1 acetyl-CoA C-acyltransferase [Hyphomonas sp.]HCJ17953.1 acetyl-CoA C-acyltransferase [Hyphomonas sp.]HCN93728.1 acetyl-CoA C-acyltransferase [Hyphomonas sp.]|tara:strand:+ start:41233 stop:42471 length:1239 start_codon:yes stop_codon:yes gene_type:complete